jgi:hypothetical protein
VERDGTLICLKNLKGRLHWSVGQAFKDNVKMGLKKPGKAISLTCIMEMII